MRFFQSLLMPRRILMLRLLPAAYIVGYLLHSFLSIPKVGGEMRTDGA